MTVESTIPSLETILAPWRETIGADFQGYRNHVYRMLHFCFFLHPPSDEERQKLIVAAAFHDIGIWSARTVDYLAPSVAEARAYLKAQNRDAWQEEIAEIIDLHHKFRAIKGSAFPLAEVFRRGDLVDFSLGFVRFDVPAAFVREIKAAFPNAGFHKRLVALTWQQIKQHPLNPAPMMKW